MWSKDGTVLTSENSYTLTLYPVSLADEGEYMVTVFVDGCENSSATYNLDVYELPTTLIRSVTPLPCTDGNQEFILDATATGIGEITYSWTGPNGFVSNNEDPVLVNVTEENSGTYTLVVTDENGCTSIPESVEIDITDALPEPLLTSSGPACIDESVILSVPAYTGVVV